MLDAQYEAANRPLNPLARSHNHQELQGKKVEDILAKKISENMLNSKDKWIEVATLPIKHKK